jgi:holo-[acyl-carrier protein] synthase
VRIIGIGTDIVNIQRVQKSLDRHGEAFAKRILHSNELEHFRDTSQKTAYLAKRFAAKEALAKALGTGIRQGIHLHEIETQNDLLGKPLFVFHGSTLKKTSELGVTESFLTLSDEQKYAVAYVILTGEPDKTEVKIKPRTVRTKP